MVDLSSYSESEIVGDVFLRVTLLVMQSIRRRDLGQRLPGILTLLRQLAGQQSDLGCLQVVLKYVAVSSSSVSENELRQAARAALPEPGGNAMPTLV